MPHPHHKKKSSHRPRHGSSSQTAHHAGSMSVRELRDKRRETSVDRRLQELAMRPGDRRAIERKVWEKKSFWDEEVEYMGQVEMQEARKESGGSREHSTSKCLRCNRFGHSAKDCREEESRCYKCYESGHNAKDCSKDNVCLVCNREGHLAKDCPDGDEKTCYRCSGKGHVAMDCPSSQREGDKVRKRNFCGETGLKRSRCREIEIEQELEREKRLRDINQRQMEELKEKERDLERLRQERMKRELEKKEEEIIAIEKREEELKEREKMLDEAARNIKRIDSLFGGTDGRISESNISKPSFKVCGRSRSRGKIRLGSRSTSRSRKNNWESRGRRFDDNNSRGKYSSAEDDYKSRGEKRSRRENSSIGSLSKRGLVLKGQVRVLNDPKADIAHLRRENGHQGGWHGRGRRVKQSKVDQRGNEERLRKQLREKEDSAKERIMQKEKEQRLKEKLRMQQKMGSGL